MKSTPDVSVVMSVYNGETQLEATIRSVLDQQGVNLEFIIVDDGSTDNSLDILRRFAASDARIVLIHQENKGLTQALVRGCAAAKGRLIARQDSGDLSLSGRIALQVEFMNRNPNVVINSCGTRYLTEAHEFMFERRFSETPVDATRLLRAESTGAIRGVTHHGSTMFRCDAYRRVGGYRFPFYFAQDLDLWTRLTDHDLLSFLPEILYEATFSPGGVSGGYNREQTKLTELIIQLRRCREAGQSEDDLLRKATCVRPRLNGEPVWRRRVRMARGLYFVAQILRQNRNPGCVKYYRKALSCNPAHWRALFGLLLARVPNGS